MMPKLTIVAHIHARPGQGDAVLAALNKVIPPTRAEAGCLQYDLHRDNAAPDHFMFYENWESRELWQAHMKSPHLAAMQAATADTIDRVVIHEMTPVE
jgi:quinol monooxygenase YgiN